MQDARSLPLGPPAATHRQLLGTCRPVLLQVQVCDMTPQQMAQLFALLPALLGLLQQHPLQLAPLPPGLAAEEAKAWLLGDGHYLTTIGQEYERQLTMPGCAEMNPGLSAGHRESLVWLAHHQGQMGLLLLSRRAWETEEGAVAERAAWQLRIERGRREEAVAAALAAQAAHVAHPGQQEAAALQAAMQHVQAASQRVAAAQHARQQAEAAYTAAEHTRDGRRAQHDLMPGKWAAVAHLHGLSRLLLCTSLGLAGRAHATMVGAQLAAWAHRQTAPACDETVKAGPHPPTPRCRQR